MTRSSRGRGSPPSSMRCGSGSSGTGGLHADRVQARRLATETMALRDAGALRIGHRPHLRAEGCSETLEEEPDAFGPRDGLGLVRRMDHTAGERPLRDLGKLRVHPSRRPGHTPDGLLATVAERRALRARLGARHEAIAVAAARRLGASTTRVSSGRSRPWTP